MASLGLRHPCQVPWRGGCAGPRRAVAFFWGVVCGWLPQILLCYESLWGSESGLGATTLNKASGKHDQACPSPPTPLNHRLPGPEPINTPIFRCPS